jgi:type IV pilus assembly protein PilY1
MYTLTKKLKFTLISVLYGMMISYPAVAEDIEIYTTSGSTNSTTQANVLFVLDTSGSMDTQVITREAYNPSTDYSGGNACYNNTRVYALKDPYDFLTTNFWGQTNAEVLCGFSSGSFNYYVSQVNRTAVVCDAASSLDSTGFYTGRISQYRNNNWDSSLAVNDLTAFVECEVDRGVHGQSTGNSAVWASKNSPPAWSSNSSKEINWANIGFSKSLYSGRYLNYIINATATSKSRINIMKEVMTNLVNSITGVNVGLMRFSSNGKGGMVATAINDIGPVGANGAGTQRRIFIDDLNRMTANGSTPLSETFYEAVMYFQGKGVDYGINSTEGSYWSGTPYPSTPASRSGNTYVSPITNECQKNYVVLLTDGDPVNDPLNSTRRGRVGNDVVNCGNSDANNCLDDIAASIGTNDQSSTLTGDQVISTYTIGFANSNPLLQQTADASMAATGVGERFFADNALSLAATLNSIIGNVFDTNASFSSPAVSVNAFNRSVHLNDLYFTLFKPAIGAHWPGNLKKYKLDFFVDVNDVDNDGDTTERLPFVADANSTATVPVNAVDAATGFFSKDAQSFWSDAVDGSDIREGGAAGEFKNNGKRKVYTFTGTYTNNNGVFVPSAASGDLTTTVNAVDKSNAAITDTMLNIVGLPPKLSPTPRIETLLDWSAGLDVFDLYGASGTTTDQRLQMGDPLHSQPALVQYTGSVDGTTPPDLVAYVATNDGYLHAIDADDGKELFSFIPQELLPNLNTLMDNNSGNKVYGLDGDVVAWINDANNDGTISGAGEHVYLYVGMRRGGRNIYSIDVTDRNNPTLRWVIKGGTGDYAELGQTWSSVNVEKIKDGNTERTVLVFGGGYDTNQDTASVRTATGDSMGRAVYIADATTGAMLWSAEPGGNVSLTEMKYSIPARVKPLDIKGDGFIDRLYVADTGGQIFRFDIDNTNGAALAGSVTGGRIADLAVDNSATDARRFYYPPDVALISERGKSSYLALAISSGYRAHPNNTDIHDRIYVIKDTDVYNVPNPYVTLTESNLYNATLNLVAGDGSAAQNDTAKAALANTDGWYIFLDDETVASNWLGEKGLSEALILEGTVIVTTFTPNLTSSSSSCNPQSGNGKVFFMNVLDASPVLSAATDKRPGRHLYGIAKSGIPPSPNVVVTKGGEPTLCVGTECKAADLLKGVRRTYWHEVEK